MLPQLLKVRTWCCLTGIHLCGVTMTGVKLASGLIWRVGSRLASLAWKSITEFFRLSNWTTPVPWLVSILQSHANWVNWSVVPPSSISARPVTSPRWVAVNFPPTTSPYSSGYSTIKSPGVMTFPKNIAPKREIYYCCFVK
ncbi:hypothetical protein J3Q64DRAFT_1442570 [Phycomyces blakesleeanus]|uniref:Secreted protein n=1 Tax=Phycomyces blakesleeanus TaxID=4837 RepID=A0ABR3B3N2_PHYBL